MDHTKQDIVQLAADKMQQVGIRSVSIDDIARELGMSKKTFYVYFATKDDLIAAILQDSVEKMRAEVLRQYQGKTVIEMMVHSTLVAKHAKDHIKTPAVLYDLRKYYPDLLKQHKLEMRDMILDLLRRFLQQGIDEGIFRSEIDISITAHFFAELHHYLMESLEQKRYSTDTILRVSKQAIDILMRGIITDEGKRKMHEQIKTTS